MSLLPVRCFTCMKVLGNFQITYDKLLEEFGTDKKKIEEFFVKNKIIRYCCKTIFLGYKNVDQTLLAYNTK